MIITSYIDENYYICDTVNNINVFMLVVKLVDSGYEELANELLMGNVLFFRELEQRLFIDKNSKFGRAIGSLINEKQVSDRLDELTDETILRALKYAIKNVEYSKFIPCITELVKNDISGSINELSTRYSIEELGIINKIGRLQEYIDNNYKQLTGFEEVGLIFDENNKLCEFDINTEEIKELSNLEEFKMAKKRKKYKK